MERVFFTSSFGLLTGKTEIEINLSISRDLTEIDKRNIKEIGYKLDTLLYEESIRNNESLKQKAIEEKMKLISLFGDEKIFVCEIPNEYSDNAYYQIFPWLLVTTTKGVFKIGWRKRVIVIDWSATLNKSLAIELFSDYVTMGDHMIHAWGYEKAKEYIEKLLQ